jgi:signal peptidase I
VQDKDFGTASFMARMEQGFDGGSKLIALLSSAYQRSDYCRKEYNVALADDPLNLKQRLIVLRVEDCQPTGNLRDLAYTDLVPMLGIADARQRKAQLRRLVRVLIGAEKRQTEVDFARLYRRDGQQGRRPATEAADWRDNLRIVVHALILAFIVRIFFFQPFNIPSGSMKETLLVGDYLFVSKVSYGYSRYSLTIPFTNIPIVPFKGRIFAAQPNRGDVVVFKLPRETEKDYIKRIMGLPGDEIQVKGGVVYINGTPVKKVRDGSYVGSEEAGPEGQPRPIPRYRETLPNGVSYHVLDSEPNGLYDNTRTFVVPPDHYFVMGDNRDNSADSRDQSPLGVGFVPFENLVGRAEIIFFSAAVDDPEVHLLRPWTWPWGIRWRRFFNLVR